LRIGIVPAMQGKSDKVYLDDKKNIMVCPIPYDGSFMELFYTSWGTTLIISKKPGNTGISRDIRTEFTTDLLLSD